MTKRLYDVTEQPPLGAVPEQMHAWLIRPERFGEPLKAFQQEVVDVPEPGDDDVLVYVMAAGVNYNNVWAGLGIPIDVIGIRNRAGEPERFHIGGSDASGIVYKVGRNVRSLKVGDEVVVHCGTWDVHSPAIRAGLDPMYDDSFRIWGYETNWGSFAQFTKVQAHQCVPKPKHLTWEAASAYMLVGATAYRMLLGWGRNSVREDDVALIWGGAGGLGSMAIQIAKAKGAIPIAVVSSNDKFEYCQSLGAKGCINRNDFDHWGMLPHWKDKVGYNTWLQGVRKFGKALWEAIGEKRNPRIIFEHPGETTIPTSIFVCDVGGMVVICAGTTGYNATVDLRYLWMRQKRLQGSHFANDAQSQGLNNLVIEGKVDPCLSRAFRYAELPESHQLMYENKHPHGNMAVLVGAPDFGLGATAEAPATIIARAQGATPPEVGRQERAPSHPQAEAMYGQARPAIEQEVPETFRDPTPIRSLMHVGLISCPPDAGLDEVARVMVDRDITALIVARPDGEPVGVVSQMDLILARQGRRPEEVDSLRARDIMTPGVLSADQDTPLHQAITMMASRRIHRLVVTEQQAGRPKAVGILSMTDVVRKMIHE